jgi:type I restriction-modification system DNA methylase subunit
MTTLEQLVKRFADNIDRYKHSSYNETQVRQEFINPLFDLMGWDVYNREGYAEQYKDVIHEDAIKVGGSTKAPDYSFRIGGQRKFFVEAKKPSVDIRGDIHPAYQLRRYAWSAKLPLSILTDFEEFAVYDCRIKPQKNDMSSAARVMYYTFTDYLEKWDEIYSVFSKDAILKGSFDRYADSSKKKRGTAEVDDAFLIEMENWRELLARNFALRNGSLSTRALNEAVQRTIDRIVFLRICEDRGIEKYGQLQSLINVNDVYSHLRQIFLQADQKYNSGLFHFQKETGRDDHDNWTLDLSVDDKTLKEILKRLYYPESPYEFSVLPSSILGQVYERFLGKVIRLTQGHQAKIEEKPEVRKAGGVFYTPTYVVDYIVKNTIGKLLEGQTPEQAAELNYCDPACGSGSFLLGAYQFLLDWHLEQYMKKPAKYLKGNNPKIYELKENEYRLTTNEKKRILLDNINGVDIDSQAVEVTKLSLLLKVLEGETEESLGLSRQYQMKFAERALPDLSNNIKCGNSLIGSDFYDGRDTSLFGDEDHLRINVFDWEEEFPEVFAKGGFDAIIGNPPYGAEISSYLKEYISKNYNHQDYQFDSYFLFIEKGIALLKKSGLWGMIIPNTWLTNLFTTSIRGLLIKHTSIKKCVHFQYKVFQKVTVDTEILIIQNIFDINNKINCTIYDKNREIKINYFLKQSSWKSEDNLPINIFLTPEVRDIKTKIDNLPKLIKVLKVTQGTKPFQKGKGKPKQTESIVKNKPYVSTCKINDSFRPLLRGSLIGRYFIKWDNDYWISYGDWLAEPRYSANFDSPEKIVIRQTGDSLIATFDSQRYIVRDNLYVIHNLQRIENIKYFLGILNSYFLTWYYQNIINSEKGEALAQVKKGHIINLPIRTIDFDIPDDVAKHDKMVQLVESMLDLNKRVHTDGISTQEKKILQKQIAITDKQIDQLVYDLYDLTEEEIKVVEGEE